MADPSARRPPGMLAAQVDAALVVARRLDDVLAASRSWGQDLRDWVEDVRALVDATLPHGQLRAALRRGRALSTTSQQRMTDLYAQAAADLGVRTTETQRMGALRLALGHAYDAGVESADAALARLRAELAVCAADLLDARRECEALHRAVERLARDDDGTE